MQRSLVAAHRGNLLDGIPVHQKQIRRPSHAELNQITVRRGVENPAEPRIQSRQAHPRRRGKLRHAERIGTVGVHIIQDRADFHRNVARTAFIGNHVKQLKRQASIVFARFGGSDIPDRRFQFRTEILKTFPVDNPDNRRLLQLEKTDDVQKFLSAENHSTFPAGFSLQIEKIVLLSGMKNAEVSGFRYVADIPVSDVELSEFYVLQRKKFLGIPPLAKCPRQCRYGKITAEKS